MPRTGAAARWIALTALLALACSTDVDDRLRQARHASEQGRAQEAIAILRDVLEREPGHGEARLLLGEALAAAGEMSLAVPHLQRALDLGGHERRAGLLLATAYLATQNFEPAIAVADRVLSGRPGDVDLLGVRARAHLQVGDTEGCALDAEALGARVPGEPWPRILQGTCLARLGRTDAAERAFEAAVEAARGGDPEVAGSACRALADFYDEALEDVTRAEVRYRSCLEAHPAHPGLLQSAVAFFERRGRPQAARAALEAALDAAPDDLALQNARATLRARDGAVAEAAAGLEAVARRLDTAAAWALHGRFLRQTGDAGGAVRALERAVARPSGEAEALRFELADALVEDGRLDEAEAMAPSLEPAVYGSLVRARVQLARGAAEQALAEVDAALPHWPNNPGARLLAGRAAERLGLRDRALAEYREAMRADAAATDAALEAARVALALGQPEQALLYARQHAALRASRLAEAALVEAQAQVALGEGEAARRGLAAWTARRGPDPDVLVAWARLESGRDGPAAAVRRIEAGGLDLHDPANHRALQALAQHLADAGRAEDALARVDAALATHADAPAFHALRARVLLVLGRESDARAALARALELDPEQPDALTALGGLRAASGEVDAGLALLDRAAAGEGGSPQAAYRAAQIALATGRTGDARRRLEAFRARHPDHAGAANDLAWILSEQGDDLDRALSLARHAVALQRTAQHLDTLGWAHLARGEVEAAREALEEAAAAAPDAPAIRYHLGLALARSGDRAGARAALHAALALGPFPEAGAARAALARLDAGE